MILRDFHEILQKFQSLDEADLVDNKIGNQEEGQEDQLAEELVVTEDVRAAQLEEELLQRTEECDEIDVVEEHLDENLDGDAPPMVSGFAVQIRDGATKSARPGFRGAPAIQVCRSL